MVPLELRFMCTSLAELELRFLMSADGLGGSGKLEKKSKYWGGDLDHQSPTVQYSQLSLSGHSLNWTPL